MKEGTLVQHPKWGKGIVIDVLEGLPFKPVKVVWLKSDPIPVRHGTTSRLWRMNVTILSEPEG